MILVDWRNTASHGQHAKSFFDRLPTWIIWPLRFSPLPHPGTKQSTYTYLRLSRVVMRIHLRTANSALLKPRVIIVIKIVKLNSIWESSQKLKLSRAGKGFVGRPHSPIALIEAFIVVIVALLVASVRHVVSWAARIHICIWEKMLGNGQFPNDCRGIMVCVCSVGEERGDRLENTRCHRISACTGLWNKYLRKFEEHMSY